MEKITLEENTYEIITDYKNGYNVEELNNKFTDYFKRYDYIFGDWAYGKLRLKGFYEKKGFKLIAEIKDWPKGITRYEFIKYVNNKNI